MSPPTPEEFIAARKRAGLTQVQTAEILHKQPRIIKYWEAGEKPIPMAEWELLLYKTGQK